MTLVLICSCVDVLLGLLRELFQKFSSNTTIISVLFVAFAKVEYAMLVYVYSIAMILDCWLATWHANDICKQYYSVYIYRTIQCPWLS